MFRGWTLIAALLVGFAGFVSAGVPSWQPMRSPQAGHADGFSNSWDPDHSWWVVYAADKESRLYKIAGVAPSWDSLWADQAVAPVSVSSEPNNYRTIYIARVPVPPDNEKLWKSVDGGTNWDPKSVGITNSQPVCLAMSPNTPNVLYLGCSPVSGIPSVFQTTNGGVAWNARPLPNQNAGVNALAVHPTNSQRVLSGFTDGASGASGGLWYSTNGGTSWVKKLNGDFFSVAWANANTAYAGGATATGQYRIYKSINGGGTWVALSATPSLQVNALATVPGTSVVFAGGTPAAPDVKVVYRSDNGGTSWTPKVYHLQDRLIYSLHRSGDGAIWAGGEKANYRSTNNGDTWVQWDQGWREHYGYGTIQTVLPGVIYVHVNANIWKTTDAGNTWTLMYARQSGPSEMVAHLTNPDKVAVCFEGDVDVDALLRSLDGGWSWEQRWTGGVMNQKFFAANPSMSDYVYLATNTKYFLRSPNWWTNIEEFYHDNWFVNCLAVHPVNYNVLYMGTNAPSPNQLLKSEDYGANWYPASGGLPSEIVEDIVVDPNTSDIAYCGTTNGLYKTTNEGTSWSLLTSSLHGVWPENCFAIDPVEPSMLALLQGPQIFLTVDGGAAWTNISQGLPGTKVRDLQIDYYHPDAIFAAIQQEPQPSSSDRLQKLTPTWQFKSLTSASSEASDYNSQRKLVREEGTYTTLHAVYHSGSTTAHNVYYTTSTDGGNSWSPKVLLGEGKHPAIALDQFGNPLVVYLSDDEHTIFYAGRIWGTWTAPYALYTQGPQYKFGPPSLVTEPLPIEQDRGHIVFHREGPEPDASWSILYGMFYPFNPAPLQPEVVDATPDRPCLRPSLARHPGTNTLHAVWCKEDQDLVKHVYYSSKWIDGGLWEVPYRIDERAFPNYDPSIEVYGDRVHAVWVNQEACHKIFYRYREIDLPVWSSVERVSGDDCVERASPQMAAGSYCVWKEGHEIFYNWRSPWEGWQQPNNLSNTSERSASPHVAFAPWPMGTMLYSFWTEDDAAPFQEYFSSFTGPLGGFFSLDAGQEQASPYTVHRGGYLQYAQQVEKTVDTDGSYLSYRFRRLDPKKLYLVRASYYQETGSPSGLEIKVDGATFANVAVPSRSVIRGEAWVPQELYADSVVELTICKKSGTLGTLGYLALCEAEPRGKGGPQSSGLADLSLPKSFSLGTGYPNPMTSEARIAYALPKASSVDLTVYNVSGQVVKRLVSEPSKAPGRYTVRWDGRNENGHRVPGGVYFYRLSAGGFTQTNKIVVVR